MRIQAFNLGKKNTELFIKSNEKIYEALKAYREIIAKNRRVFYSNEITNARFELSSVIAELRLMPSVSKYVFEITTLIGMVGISAIQFLLVDATKATATIAIFLAAGTRIAPSILRLQQYFIQINANTGIAKLTLDFIETLPIKPSKKLIPEFNDTHSDFDARVEVRQLSFAYPGASLPSLLNINLAISKGTKCAIVGPSGSGKTTLVDILLGAIETNSGDVCVSGMTPLEAINRFPGAIGYVPQEVEVFRASIRTNVALGFPKDEATDERVMRALKIAQLNDFIESLPNGLETMIGENGFMISVGQKQRLGIARAMFTSPKLIFLDESTSSLDALTELSVTQALSEIPFDVTLVVIAHRLSTIREFDQIIYLKGGEILAQGSFQEVRELVPDFETQVRLMGIVD
jgi:ABC-type multidrug transport system fused ATPase/permease subunit